MARLLDFLREWVDIRRESKSYCKSCETLKEQLIISNHEKQQLLNKFVLVKVETAHIEPGVPEPIVPKMVPWRVQRELLESEDRAKALAIRRQQEDLKKANETIENKSNSLSVAELEKELGVQ